MTTEKLIDGLSRIKIGLLNANIDGEKIYPYLDEVQKIIENKKYECLDFSTANKKQMNELSDYLERGFTKDELKTISAFMLWLYNTGFDRNANEISAVANMICVKKQYIDNKEAEQALRERGRQ